MIFQWNIDCRASSIFLPYSFSFLSILEYIHWIFEPLPRNDIKTLRQNLQNVISRQPSMTEENRFRVTRIELYFFHAKKNKKILFAFLFFFFHFFHFFIVFSFFSLSLSFPSSYENHMNLRVNYVSVHDECISNIRIKVVFVNSSKKEKKKERRKNQFIWLSIHRVWTRWFYRFIFNLSIYIYLHSFTCPPRIFSTRENMSCGKLDRFLFPLKQYI